MTKDALQAHIENFLKMLGFSADTITVSEDLERRMYKVDIALTKDQERAIGRQGTVLEAIQTLVNAFTQKQQKAQGFHVLIDINGYREQKRKDLMVRVERQLQEKWLATQVELWPMSGMERRYVHEHYAKSTDFTTESRGFGAGRYIVIHRVTQE